jgi:hypothetical protein
MTTTDSDCLTLRGHAGGPLLSLFFSFFCTIVFILLWHTLIFHTKLHKDYQNPGQAVLIGCQ